MKKKFGTLASIALAVLMFNACGDDGGASAPSGENANGVFHETMTDDRDGRTYKTVVIGAQTWMAENLDYEYKANDSTYGNWCYGNSADNCAKYGRLYSWAAAMDSATTGCGDGKACTASSEKVQGHLPRWLAFAEQGGMGRPLYGRWRQLHCRHGVEDEFRVDQRRQRLRHLRLLGAPVRQQDQ